MRASLNLRYRMRKVRHHPAGAPLVSALGESVAYLTLRFSADSLPRFETTSYSIF
jgi:hypothetical protein